MDISIRKVDPSLLRHEYGILCQRLYPTPDLQTPFGTTWCVVEPGGSTVPHAHSEGESFLILEGRGEMTVDDRRASVEAGDLVYLPPGSRHVLSNPHGKPIRFLSLWWEASAKPLALHAAPPTPNGPLHLGHLSGPYFAGDVLNRVLRQSGRKSHYLCGTDDYQSYVLAKAEDRGESADMTRDHFAGGIRRTFERAGIAFDHFLEPRRDEGHRAFVEAFFLRLRDKGALERRTEPALHCGPCGRYLFEVYVTGRCPHCGEMTAGQGCEACGLPNQAVDLVEPRCSRCGASPELRPTARWFFSPSRYADALFAFWSDAALSARMRALTAAIADKAMGDVPVTHYADWGIPVPGGGKGEVIHAWMEMAASYLYAESRLGLADPDRVLLFDFDNGYYYTTLVPALWKAYDPSLSLPVALVTNEFLQLEGRKFSTSRRHAVWAEEALETNDRDLLRLYLLYRRPEHAETEFSFPDYRSFLSRLSRRTDGDLAGIERDFHRCLRLDRLDLSGATRHLCRYLAAATGDAMAMERFARLAEPWLPDWSRRFLDGEVSHGFL